MMVSETLFAALLLAVCVCQIITNFFECMSLLLVVTMLNDLFSRFDYLVGKIHSSAFSDVIKTH